VARKGAGPSAEASAEGGVAIPDRMVTGEESGWLVRMLAK
jgi:hypothetical protein